MRIYNTASKQIDEFKPKNPPTVTIYTCGPTVYDYSHVGHWFNYVRMDMLVRALKSIGYAPDWVMNITDVGHLVSDADEGEDKLEKGARRDNKSAWEVAEFYTNDFISGMKDLNMLTPTKIVKATDHIADQIDLISQLEAKGYTYIIEDDGVYYDTSKFKTYGQFAGLDLDEQQAGTRIEANPLKRRPSDFALWKFSPKDKARDMEWDSPWGKGFPGWHIECSAMAMKYLGETLDIHTGGIDHIPVHHTNEIAQSEAITGKRFANYWLHSNHVLIDNQKISKSLGNTITLQDLKAKNISPEALRLHVLESHYRNQSKFSWDSLMAAKNRLDDLKAMAALRYQAKEEVYDATTFSLEDVPLEISKLLQDDLNTPEALAFLSHVSTQLTSVLIEKDMVDHFEAMLGGIDNILGTKLLEVKDIGSEERELIDLREKARQASDWAKADDLRRQLESRGVGLRDSSRGTIWFPIS